jgi:hypothetical protein
MVKDRPEYSAPTQQKPDPTLMTAPKKLATRYYQLTTGHAVIGTHLERINAMDDDRCWWCNNGERQTVKHLFKNATPGEEKEHN